MNFKIIPSNKFNKQLKKLDGNSKEIIYDKIQLIKQNPYRYKKIHSNKFSRVFRVKLSINKQDTRLVYVIIEPDIILACLLDRGRNYKDLDKYLKRI